jgi:hypothetical protein
VTYDAEGRLIATAGTQYEYNAGGERVSKDNSAGAPQTLYLHDGDGNQIAELNAALVVQHVNVYSGKHLVGTWNPASGQVYYAYSDWLPGSPTTRGPQRANFARWGEGIGLRPWGGEPALRRQPDGVRGASGVVSRPSTIPEPYGLAGPIPARHQTKIESRSNATRIISSLARVMSGL